MPRRIWRWPCNVCGHDDPTLPRIHSWARARRANPESRHREHFAPSCGNSGSARQAVRPERTADKRKTAGLSPRRLQSREVCRDQRSSCSTLCCDWLASDSADTAIDWRVDSASLSASELVGVRQRQVGSAGLQHVDQALVEVLTDLHHGEVRTEGRSFRAQGVAGGVSVVSTEFAELLSRKSVPASGSTDRDGIVKVTPGCSATTCRFRRT